MSSTTSADHRSPLRTSEGPSGRLDIDLSAIAQNYRKLKQYSTNAEVGAVVKADAYGLGARRVAPVLEGEGCQKFFVAQLSEAIDLRPWLRPRSKLYVLNGLGRGEEEAFCQTGCIPVLNSIDQVRAWAAYCERSGRRSPVALQFDTGMSRLGIAMNEAHKIFEEDMLCALQIEMILSHLACAEDPNNAFNDTQVKRFLELARMFPGAPLSLSNSAATLTKNIQQTVARAGLALYGAEPVCGLGETLERVVKLSGRIIQIRQVEQGVGVGYGLTWIATSKTRLAIVGVGYADGWPRATSNKGAAWFEGFRLPIVGNVSMDSMVVDISELPEVSVREGDFVELIGPSQSLEQVAESAGTISYEILTRLSARLSRSYHYLTPDPGGGCPV